jgi:hypothetical protein
VYCSDRPPEVVTSTFVATEQESDEEGAYEMSFLSLAFATCQKEGVKLFGDIEVLLDNQAGRP